MQNDTMHGSEQQTSKGSDGSVTEPSQPSNQIENPEKVLLERFRESRQSVLIQVYFYGGITVFALCAAIFLMMYLA
jgi:hypothetical protein